MEDWWSLMLCMLDCCNSQSHYKGHFVSAISIFQFACYCPGHIDFSAISIKPGRPRQLLCRLQTLGQQRLHLVWGGTPMVVMNCS